MLDVLTPAPSSRARRFAPIWHGHVFLFDRRIEPPDYASTIGLRLLLLAIALEAFRLAMNATRLALLPMWVRGPLFVFVTLAGVRTVGLSGRALGLRPWREWNATENAYFLQALIITNVVFPAMFAAQLSRTFAQTAPLTILATVFVPYLFLGFFQELLYRGILQTELTRRWGPGAGILASNLVYTFVQHLDYFAAPASSAIPLFAAVFAMGLVFAVVFWRSGNLWIVGVMHAFGNAYVITTFGRIT